MTRSSIACAACLALIVAAALPLASADDEDTGSSASTNASVLVTLAPLTEGTLPHVIVGYGTIEAARSGRRAIVAPTSSIVQAVYVRLGEQVAAGAPLIQLAPSAATAAAYSQAKSAVAVADRLVASTRSLVAHQLATRQQLADAEKSASDARAQLQALEAVGAGAPRIARAPFRAIVTGLAASPGAIVTEGATLAELADAEKLVLNVGVVPSQAGRIAANDRAAVTLIGTDESVPGTVMMRGDVAEPDTGLVPVEISLAPGRFLPGEMAQAAITAGESHGYVVPHQAVLVDDSGATYVIQAIGEKAKKVPVTVIGSQSDRDVIAGALDKRAPLVLTGNHQLDDGMKIRVAEPEASKGSR
ncbi:MAG: efflux RND transporter periplasmic adaptor subunit [Steroidobacteraceae bacterium]